MMSDQLDDQILGDSSESAAPVKAKGGGAGILKILMWVGIGLGLVILIVTIVLIVMGIRDSQGTPMTAVPVTEEYEKAPPLYVYSEIIGDLRVSTADVDPVTVVVRVLLGSDEKDKKLDEELIQRKFQLIDAVRSYFAKKKASELMNEDEVKEQIREMVNRMLEHPGVKEILFQKFDIQRF